MRLSRIFALLPALALAACGSRSSLHVDAEKAGRGPIECMSDSDCQPGEDLCALVACREGICELLGARACDDGDPCTEDRCDPKTGACHNEPLTEDRDGDGHRAPLPGFRPGAPGSCGDDCDDEDPNAFPGNVEVCDGVDNDCNGVIDDGMVYLPDGEASVLVSEEGSSSTPGGLISTEGGYLASYSAQQSGLDSAFVVPAGADFSLGERVRLNDLPFQADAGPLARVGERFGVAYFYRLPGSDKRLRGYEVRFQTLSQGGEKLGDDVKIHGGISSFNALPSVLSTGTEFIVVWAHRLGSGYSDFHVYAQRLDAEGQPIGESVLLSRLPGDNPNAGDGTTTDNEAPALALGKNSVGVVWTRTRAAKPQVYFQSLDLELRKLTEAPVEITGEGLGAFPTIAWNQASERYVIAFFDPSRAPYAIYGATVAEGGEVITPARPITESPRHSRYPSLLPLGDRTLLVFSDDKDQNQGYELYTKMLGESLEPLGPELRITEAIGDSVLPITSFGPNGDVGILFRDNRSGRQGVYLTRLVCGPEEPR